MTIKQAKQYLKDTVQIYLKRDEYGEYCIPLVRQRPIFLVGAPGIGKTAIMEQVAAEMGIALVSYSMTHHTRQSALGLPFIRHREYDGQEFDVSEYTMSEIIASVYEVMENSGVKQGILFLDEINCVSETLAPSMLQFLQYKVFGRHQVPEGWVIVTAGNPPEYNRSVREFDVVTMDRLKVLEVEEDYPAWKEYAVNRGLHNAIVNFLDMKKSDFYLIETTANGKNYVTARGWEDLSQILKLYEQEKLKVDETLIGQYLHCERIVREFTAYYDLYCKYKKDYEVDVILAGKASQETVRKAKEAPFDERLSLLGILVDQLQADIRQNLEHSDLLTQLMAPLKAIGSKVESGADTGAVLELLGLQEQGRRKSIAAKAAANALSEQEKRLSWQYLRFFVELQRKIRQEATGGDGKKAFEIIKAELNKEVEAMKTENVRVKERLHALFEFVERAFAGDSEMLLLMTQLTVNENSSRFISLFGCEDYQKHNEEMMLSERKNSLTERIAALEL